MSEDLRLAKGEDVDKLEKRVEECEKRVNNSSAAEIEKLRLTIENLTARVSVLEGKGSGSGWS